MQNNWTLIFKSSEEPWLRAMHPKLKRKTVKVNGYGLLPKVNGEYQGFYAIMKFYDLAGKTIHTKITTSYGMLLVDIVSTVSSVYKNR